MRAIGADLLSKIRDELDARLRELRPLLAEYERLLAAAAALEVERESAPAPAGGRPAEPRRGRRAATPKATAPRAPASAPAAPVADGQAAVSTPTPAPTRRRGRPPGRPRADRSAGETPARAASSTAARRAGGVPKPARKRAERGAAGVAIVAALEHGSHTVSELVIVTAMSAPIINDNIRRLQQAGTITRTKRPGDGKAAYALAFTVA